MSKNYKSLVGFLTLLVLASCGTQSNITSLQTSSSTDTAKLSPYDVNMYALHKVVCDPLAPGDNPGPNDGLKAELFYLNSTQPHYQRLEDYFSQGTKSSKFLFFSKVDVPTRIFNQGFPSETGSMLVNDLGENLIEYFALRFNSVLKLSDQDEEGEYELALLADDGAKLYVRNEAGVYDTLVDNDGDHSAKMGCGGKIQMTKQSEKVVRLEYYQGPRNNIALIPLWRKVTPTTVPEPQCGVQSNSLYFDYNHGSTPRQAYLDMLARGWKPIAAANWHLPQSAVFNPCVVELKPTISNYQLVKMVEGVVEFSWNTDFETTSQILYKNVRTGEEQITTSDNIVRTSHAIRINGLVYNDTYEFRAVSISARFGKAVSDPITLQVK